MVQSTVRTRLRETSFFLFFLFCFAGRKILLLRKIKYNHDCNTCYLEHLRPLTYVQSLKPPGHVHRLCEDLGLRVLVSEQDTRIQALQAD